jgi:hypothetical protein
MNFSDLVKLKGHKEERRIVSAIDDLFDVKNDVARMMLERIWWRNFLYYCGEQWIEYMRSTRTFARKLLPPGASTPVCNKVREFVRAQKAMLLNQKLVAKIAPNTNERADEEAAKLGQEVMTWLNTINEGEIEDEKEKCAIWTVTAGTTYMRSFPDKDAGEMFTTPEGTTMKTGQVVREHVIPFNVHLDSMGDKLTAKRWVGVETLKPREWVEDTFKVLLGKAESPRGLDYQRRLMKLVGQVSPWKGDGIETTALDTDLDDLVIYRELEAKPNHKFPEGRFLVTCQDKLLIDVERMPIKVENGSWFYTLTDFHWNYVPGRFYSDSGVDDIISPQNRINKIDKALDDNRETIGRPRVLSGGEIHLERLTDKGESFLVLRYDAKTSGGVAPVFQQGTTYGPEVLAERKLAEQGIQDAAGDPKNILQGKPPSASSSGVQVDLLQDLAKQGHTPDIDRWNRSLTRVDKKALLLVKELYTEERLIKVAGRGGTSQVKNFKGADLKDNTDLKLELDSGLSTTRTGQLQILSNLAENGYLGDVANDPEIRSEFLRRYGLSGFTGKENVDIERAESENSAIANGDVSKIMLVEMGEPDPLTGQQSITILVNDPLFKYDNHLIHFGCHRKFILSPEFRYLEEKAQVVLMNHTDYHQQLMIEEAQAQAIQQMAVEAEAGASGSTQPKTNQGAQVNG